MIIVLKGADFSTSNIGTLSTWRITCSLGAGAIYEGPNSVEKGHPLSATIDLQDGYRAIEEQMVLKMGGDVVEGAITMISGEEPYIISIPSVTGNVTIAFPTEVIVPDEPDVPVDPDPEPDPEPEEPDDPVTPDDGTLTGSGTEADPYLISTASQFKTFRSHVDDGSSGATTNGKYYALANDIDLRGEVWDPIGGNEKTGTEPKNIFKGTLDGRGYAIRNLTTRKDVSYTGLFGSYCAGTIMNLGLEGEDSLVESTINGGNVGSIARKLTGSGKIVNCYSLINTHGLTRSGGLLDDLEADAKMLGSYYAGVAGNGVLATTPTHKAYTLHAASATTGTIKYCFWDSDKTPTTSTSGGLSTNGTGFTNNEGKTTAEFASMHNTLNTNLTTVANLAGIDVSKLCTWEAGADGYPRLVKK